MTTKGTRYNKSWMERQRKKGRCIFCSKKSLEHSKMCEKHYFKMRASGTLKNREMAEEIKALFYFQDCRCYISGIKLVLGLNDSLDHIIPVSRAPELIDDIRNLRWCDRKVNMIKRDLTYEEFLELCRLVLKQSETY